MNTHVVDEAERPVSELKSLVLQGQRYTPVLVTAALFVIMYGVGVARYPAFGYPQVFVNLFIDNAFLLVLAVGMTFVILTGGIDLSVGAVLAVSTVISAWLVTVYHWPAPVVMALILVGGTVFGAGMGAVIHYFEIQPFIVTLAGMFLARGLSYVISTDSITITDPTYTHLAQQRIHLGSTVFVSVGMLVALAVVAAAFVVLHYTRLGRTVYALGGNEQSAVMMGLPWRAPRLPPMPSAVAARPLVVSCSPSTPSPGGVCTRSAWNWMPSLRWSSAARCSLAAPDSSWVPCSAP